MRAFLLVAALSLAGCAASRPPGTLPEPVTLAEVNRALAGTRATVYFTDGREPQEWQVEVGPETTRLIGRARALGKPRVEIIPTANVAQIEIDDSLSLAEGASKGFRAGTAPGAAAFVVGLGISAVDESPSGCFFICFSPGEALAALGAAGAIAGAVLGPTIGAASVAQRYPVTVYQAPVTRYPDAALALLDAAPLAEPVPAETPVAEAAEPRR